MATEPVLSLGGVPFDVIEQPENLPIGGVQATNIIKFPGGNINVQQLGAYEDPISLTGTFWYEGALTRALAIDKFRIDGSEVLMKWGQIARYVLVTSFKPVIYNAEWVDYSLELTPTRASSSLVATAAAAVNKRASSVHAEAYVQPPGVDTTGNTTSANTTKQAVKYRVKDGDTLWAIAQKFYGKTEGNKFTLIASANGLDNPNQLEAGQLLTIPE